ncbi:MAG: type I restriction enzyme HsdR N-terminal domain-containing protein [Desulfobacterales bacterium]
MIFTKCTNEECGQKYKIKAVLLGQVARCKKCSTVFKIEEFTPPSKIIELGDGQDDSQGGQAPGGNKTRRSPQEVMQEHIDGISSAVEGFLPRLAASLNNQDNESDTRLLINQMLQDILGYRLEDIKTEQKIGGRRADYVLSINNEDALVIEAKKIGMALRDNQIFQASAYAAYSGMKWVVLTNALVWQLYHVSMNERVKTDLVFSIDLMDGLDDTEAWNLYLISKNGMSRKNVLEKAWQKISALCYDNIVEAILTDGVITRIRTTLCKLTGCQLRDEEVRQTIEENIFQLS